MRAQRGRIVAGRRLRVPADVRRFLGVVDGDPVIMGVGDGALHVRLIRDALSRIRLRPRGYVPTARLDGELIAGRCEEARHG